MAGLLWLGAGSAISYLAASRLWSIDGIRAARAEFSTNSRRRIQRSGLIVHHATLPPYDITRRDGLIVTTPARTLLDLAGVLSPDRLEIALESVLRKGLATPTQINEVLGRGRTTVPGRGALRTLLAHRPSKPTGSTLETILWQVCRDNAFPFPVRQFPIADETGIVVARADFAYPQVHIAFEADGYDWHSSKLAWQTDIARQNELMRLEWAVFRFTWDDVTKRRAATVAQIANILSPLSGPLRSATRNAR